MDNIEQSRVRATQPRGWSRRLVLMAFFGGVATALGVGAIAQGVATGGFGHHGALSGHSPADVNEHVDFMMKIVYAEIDATDAQKAQIDPLVKQAVADLMPLREQVPAVHEQAVALLTADRIDRVAIEDARVEHLRVIDGVSRRLTQLFGDIAEVLTPEQRKAMAEHVAHRRAWHHR